MDNLKNVISMLKKELRKKDDEINRLEARVKDLSWQPIETAPRDGTLVDIWHKHGFVLHHHWWADDDDEWCGHPDSEFLFWRKISVPQLT